MLTKTIAKIRDTPSLFEGAKAFVERLTGERKADFRAVVDDKVVHEDKLSW